MQFIFKVLKLSIIVLTSLLVACGYTGTKQQDSSPNLAQTSTDHKLKNQLVFGVEEEVWKNLDQISKEKIITAYNQVEEHRFNNEHPSNHSDPSPNSKADLS